MCDYLHNHCAHNILVDILCMDFQWILLDIHTKHGDWISLYIRLEGHIDYKRFCTWNHDNVDMIRIHCLVRIRVDNLHVDWLCIHHGMCKLLYHRCSRYTLNCFHIELIRTAHLQNKLFVFMSAPVNEWCQIKCSVYYYIISAFNKPFFGPTFKNDWSGTPFNYI